MVGSTITVIDPLIPKISKDLEIGFDKISYIFIIGAVFSLFFTIISGRLSDKFNIDNIILIGLVIFFSSFLTIGFSVNILIFIIVIIFFRIGFGVIDTAIHAYTSKVYFENISNVFVKLDIFHYLGAAVTPLIIGIILFFNLDYKLIFLIIAILFFIALFIFIIVKRNKDRKIVMPGLIDLTAAPTKLSTNISIFKVLKNKIILLAGIVIFFTSGALFGASTWYTTYSTTFNLPIFLGSLVVSLYWGVSIIGLVISSKLVQKISEVKIITIFTVFAVIFLTCFNLVPFQGLKVALLILTSISLTSIFPMSCSLSVKEMPEFSGTILGFNITFCYLGILLIQPVIGVIAEYINRSYIMLVALVSALLGLVFAF